MQQGQLLRKSAHSQKICQLLLFTPVRTQCNHLLCASCMAQWADASSTNQIEHSSLDVHLADFDPNYDPSYDLEANCPMCRTRTSASPDKRLARQLEAKYPITYAERRVEEEVDRGSRIGQGGVEGVMILIGNKHRLIRNPGNANAHLWTFFVRMSRPELIKEVHIYLVSLDFSRFLSQEMGCQNPHLYRKRFKNCVCKSFKWAQWGFKACSVQSAIPNASITNDFMAFSWS